MPTAPASRWAVQRLTGCHPGLGAWVSLPDLPDLSSGQEGLPALRDTRESVGLDIVEIHLCDLTASALGLHLLEPCLFQPNVALVRGRGFSCAKALEGTGEAELALGLDLRVSGGGSLPHSRKGSWPWSLLGGTAPEPPAKPSPILFVGGLASAPEKGFSWLKVFLQGSLGTAALPWEG